MKNFESIKCSFGMDDDKGSRKVHPLPMKVDDSELFDEEEAAIILS